MSYGFGRVEFSPAALDAFGRQRISSIDAEFECKFLYGNEERSYVTTVVGTGAATFSPNTASFTLTNGGTASGAKVTRQSWQYLRYYPGKSQLIQMTGVIGAATQNVVKRIGYFDDNDGLFFVQNGLSGLGVVRRTSTSGSPVDNVIYQASWNINRLDGTGPSGITVDVTKTQIMLIDFQWLGVGAIRFGFVINGALHYVHQINNANGLDVVYMKSAWLPLRYELENVGIAGGIVTMSQICSAVNSEGGIEPPGNLFTAARITAATISATAWTPIISIQVQSTLNGQPFRGAVYVDSFDTLVSGVNPVVFQLIEQPTLTNASWTQTSTTSGVFYDVSATAATGGTPRASALNARSTSSAKPGNQDLNATVGTIYTLVGRSVGGNSEGIATISWREVI